MSQQGGRPTGHEDDWWGQLYGTDDDTGPTPAPDTLDDRFASAAGAVRDGTAAGADGEGAAAGSRGGRTAEESAPAGGVGGTGLGGRGPDDEPGRRPGGGVPAPRSGGPAAPQEPPDTGPGRHRAPWEPPAAPQGPAVFPPGPKPPGFAERPPEDRPPAPPGGRTSTETPPATSVPASRMPSDPPPASPQETEGPRHGDAGGDGVERETHPRRPAGDWWAAATPGSGPGSDSVEQRTGPGSTQPNPTTGPPAGARPDATGTGRDAGAARQDDEPPPAAASAPADPDSTPHPEPPTPHPLRTATRVDLPALPPGPVGYVGSGPPTYDAEPTALPPADPDELDDLVADTVLDGARYGACTLRAASVRGDSARFRGEPRRDSLLTARFGTGEQALVLVAMATGARATPGAHRAAAEACHWIGRAVGRSHARLAQDIGAARRGDLKSGLHRLTDRSLGKLRASAAEQGIDPEEYAASLRCLLLPADPECRIRVFFGVGAGGLFRLRDGEWHDIEPQITDVTGEPVVGFGSLPAETPEGDRLTMDLGIPTPPSPYEPAPEPAREPFRFRASVARPGDTLLMCTGGLAEPLRGEPELGRFLTGRWSGPPPGLATFLADSQVRVKGYADDRTAAAVWEA